MMTRTRATALTAAALLTLTAAACTNDEEPEPTANETTLEGVASPEEEAAVEATWEVVEEARTSWEDPNFDYSTIAIEPALEGLFEVQGLNRELDAEIEGSWTDLSREVVSIDLHSDPPLVEVKVCRDTTTSVILDDEGNERPDLKAVPDVVEDHYRTTPVEDGRWVITQWKTETEDVSCDA